MGKRLNTVVFSLLATLAVSACGSQERHMNVTAPLPPLTQSQLGAMEMQQIQPANGLALAASAAAFPVHRNGVVHRLLRQGFFQAAR